jgi:membrane protease YdiL (CAAX protease family)
VSSRWRRITVFYVTTFAVTHAVTTVYRARGGSWNTLGTFVVANGIMLIPGLVALALARWVFRQPLRETLGLRGRPNRWWLVAWLLPPLLMLATLAVSLLVPGTSYDATMSGLGARMGFSSGDAATLRARAGFLGLSPLAGFLAQGLLVGPTLTTIGGLGEELAWRGWLYHELAPLGFWRCSLITGALWGLWHVPLTLQGYGYPQHPIAGTLVFLIYVLLFTPVLTYVRLRAGSVVAPAILHGTADATVLLTLALIGGGGDLTTGWGSLSCVVVLAGVDVAIAIAVAREHRAIVRP